ncbi:MAG: hypothetical protein KGL39_18775, partial [Patescibacteria group bacterium]|nr:hypothetical protein [Patescibacteria group bacterium]
SRVIQAYQAFRANLRGWCDVPFTTFRNVIAANRERSEWSAADKKAIGAVVESGGGYALKAYYKGTKAEKALKVVFADAGMGGGPTSPEPMSREDLDAHMKSLVKRCVKDGWTNKNFSSFIVYLESDMRASDLETKADDPDAKKGDDTALPDDEFAAMYRSGSEMFRRAVRGHLVNAVKGA